MAKIHDRQSLVNSARNSLERKLIDWSEENRDLTLPELISVVTSVMASEVGSITKLMIREERNGNDETPGGLKREEEL